MTENAPQQLDTLQRSVRALAPLVYAHVEEAERNHRLSPPVVAALREAKLFRLYTPKTLGGLEVPPQVLYRVVEEISRVDGSTGWCTFIGAVAGLFGAFLPDAGAEQRCSTFNWLTPWRS
ncbi:MAG TPA: acyl-CoA dehydrogenase family protein [Candidatus Binatia bacterium]|nr:acyl-CoA dehydrogenase family protein [Candidatus Binatia bacterium]